MFNQQMENKYIMYFIDDYTRMCWVYLLKDKLQDFETLKKIHVWIQNEAQTKIDILHNDNGGEYTSNYFEGYLHQYGKKHQTIVPYNPQQNGVVERMNKTLLNMIHLVMFFKNLKLMFWDYVVLCAVYLRNTIPTHDLNNKTPYEMWHGHNPLVGHLRVIGCTCYSLILKEQRNKLGLRSGKCILFGYSNT